MFSSHIYTKSSGSTDFQKALSGIHCMMFVTPNAEHLRSVRPRRQALSMIVHFTYQRTGSLALRCHLPPCYVHDYWFLIFVCVCVCVCVGGGDRRVDSVKREEKAIYCQFSALLRVISQKKGGQLLILSQKSKK